MIEEIIVKTLVGLFLAAAALWSGGFLKRN
jgi:hypothetical protein